MNTDKLFRVDTLEPEQVGGAVLCAPRMPTAQKLSKLPTTRIYDAQKDKVWPLVISEIGLEYPVRALEKESGLITTDFVAVPAGFNNSDMDRWVYSPGIFMATWAGLRVTLSVMVVESEPGKTQVTIVAHFDAYENNVEKSWVGCESNGSLENDILTRIAQKLPPKQP